ncbi:MAG TPA: exo-alpha-sialidase, partial [Spirochaetia bacterium]|nr:exo-alpha-sialidase [Spirochaetia bacterium]
FSPTGVELFVSSEKAGIPYPDELERFRKPGTGIWTIDRLRADSPEKLTPVGMEEVFTSDDPAHIHVKDPYLFRSVRGDDVAVFCSHPFNWSSSNSVYSVRPRGSEEFGPAHYGFFPRGFTWDVAMSRITGSLAVPRVGAFADLPPLVLFFYDGGESVRNYQEHEKAVRRPRGYSCEELGGLAFGIDDEELSLRRISTLLPSFISPYGTGSSRYVKPLVTEEGIFATWQQSQPNRSQPLVMNFLPMDRVRELLTA